MARIGITIGFAALGAVTGGLGAFPAFFGTSLENAAGLSGAFLGGMLGMGVGNTLGSALFPAHGPHQYGPRLGDLMVSTSQPGSSIPIPFGETRYAAQIIWAPGLVESSETVSQQSKDGGVTSTTYQYSASFAASFGEGPADVEEIWLDSKIGFTWDEAPNTNTIPAYNSANTYAEGDIVSFGGKYYIALKAVPAGLSWGPKQTFGGSFWAVYTGPLTTSSANRYTVPTIYPGTDTQNPDPTILASNGDTLADNSNTPAFRGLVYAVWNQLNLRDFGNRLPNVVGLVKSRNASSLDSVAANILARCNVDSSEMDLSGLSTVNVRGYTITRATDGRTAIAQLAQGYLFDVFESDFQLKGKLRSDTGDPVMTIPESDLGLMKDNAKLTEVIQQFQDLPIEVEIQYSDPAQVWQNNKQQRRRHPMAVRTRNKAVIELPLVLSQTEAIQLAERYLYLSWLERKPWSFSLWKAKYAVLDPTDIIAFTYGGNTYHTRLMSNSIGQNYSTEIQAVSHDSAAYESITAGGGSDGTFIPITPVTATTLLWQFDLPYLQDGDAQDSLDGFYWAVGSTTAGYPGAAFYSSLDDVNFTSLGGSAVGVTFGTTIGALGDPGPDALWSWDDDNTLTVQVKAGTISSTSEAMVFDGVNSALLQHADGSAELIQFANADLDGLATDGSGDSLYVLSHLLRGRRNTEYAAYGHADGETIVFLPNGLQRTASQPLTFVGAARYYKAATFGTDPSVIAGVSFTSQGNDLKPASPVHLTGARDMSNNLTIGWTRRTRFGGRGLVGPTPLHESVEAHEIDVLSGLTVLRTISWVPGIYDGDGLPTAAYSAADQTTDGLTPGDPVSVIVYQISTDVGRGFPGPATI
jgi:hypothetical protein